MIQRPLKRDWPISTDTQANRIRGIFSKTKKNLLIQRVNRYVIDPVPGSESQSEIESLLKIMYHLKIIDVIYALYISMSIGSVTMIDEFLKPAMISLYDYINKDQLQYINLLDLPIRGAFLSRRPDILNYMLLSSKSITDDISKNSELIRPYLWYPRIYSYINIALSFSKGDSMTKTLIYWSCMEKINIDKTMIILHKCLKSRYIESAIETIEILKKLPSSSVFHPIFLSLISNINRLIEIIDYKELSENWNQLISILNINNTG